MAGRELGWTLWQLCCSFLHCLARSLLMLTGRRLVLACVLTLMQQCIRCACAGRLGGYAGNGAGAALLVHPSVCVIIMLASWPNDRVGQLGERAGDRAGVAGPAPRQWLLRLRVRLPAALRGVGGHRRRRALRRRQRAPRHRPRRCRRRPTCVRSGLLGWLPLRGLYRGRDRGACRAGGQWHPWGLPHQRVPPKWQPRPPECRARLQPAPEMQ